MKCTGLGECFMVSFHGRVKMLQTRVDPTCVFFIEYLTKNHIILEKHVGIEVAVLVHDPVRLGAVVLVKLQGPPNPFVARRAGERGQAGRTVGVRPSKLALPVFQSTIWLLRTCGRSSG
jgi:hypothetical protein